MNVSQLEYFVVIADEGTMQKAAARLFVSQPALSQSIAGLEKELGQLLFRRGVKGMELTEYGAKLLPLARDVLAKVGDMQALTREYEEHATIGVLFIPLLAGNVVPGAAARFRAHYPKVRLRLEDWGLHAHGAGKASLKDYSFVLGFDPMGELNVSRKQKKERVELGRFRRVAWVSAASSLAGKDALSAADCEGRQILLGDWDLADFRRLLPEANLNLFTGMGMWSYLSRDPEAIGILPSLFGVDAAMGADTGTGALLVPRRLDFADATFTLSAYYDGNRPMPSPEKAFLDALRQECAQAEDVANGLLASV